MEKQKYYTPDLSELYVGFEIETFNISEEWILINGTKGSEKPEHEKAQILVDNHYDKITWYKETIKPTNISRFMPFKVHVSDEPIFSSKKTKVSVEYFPLNYVRVKYLDKEDIESLGFESQYCPDCYNDDELKDGFVLSINEKEDVYLHLNNDQNISIVKSIMYNEHSGNWYDVKLFKGNIKNKSELKRLLTQIGVL